MAVNLPVIYKSQWDADASETRDDCGPACISMTLDFYKVKTTINEVFKKTAAAANALISIAQMSTAISAYGFTAKYYTNQSFDQLKSFLDRQIPVIALVHYGDFSSRQDKGFSGGHFFLVVGYRDDGVFVNDPDFWGSFRQDGDHHFYTMTDFLNGWKNASKDGNPVNSFLVFEPKDATTIPVEKGDFERMVKEGTQWREMHTYFGFPGEPKDSTAEEGKRVVNGYKGRITDLQTQLSTANSEVENRGQQVERLKQEKAESAKMYEARIDALNKGTEGWTKLEWDYLGRIKTLEGTVTELSKEKGGLLTKITVLADENKNLRAGIIAKLSLPELIELVIAKLFHK